MNSQQTTVNKEKQNVRKMYHNCAPCKARYWGFRLITANIYNMLHVAEKEDFHSNHSLSDIWSILRHSLLVKQIYTQCNLVKVTEINLVPESNHR